MKVKPAPRATTTAAHPAISPTGAEVPVSASGGLLPLGDGSGESDGVDGVDGVCGAGGTFDVVGGVVDG